MFSFPTRTAPASFRRAVTSASSVGTRSAIILEPAVVRAPVGAGGDVALRPAGGGERILVGDGNESVEAGVQAVDALQAGLGELHGGELIPADEAPRPRAGGGRRGRPCAGRCRGGRPP